MWSCPFCILSFSSWSLPSGLGWGGLLTFMFTRSRGGCCVADMFSWGVGWGGLITFMCTSTHTQARLRSCTFSCTSTHTSCYATVHSHSYAAVHSLTLPHTRHATLLYVLYFALPQAHVMLRHAAVRSLAIPHTHTSSDIVHLHAIRSSLALKNILQL